MSVNLRNAAPPQASILTIAVGESRRVTFAQAAELKITGFGQSDLPQFAGSRFVASPSGSGFGITRVRDIEPVVGVELALNLPEVLSLFIHTTSMTSARPDLRGARFAVRQRGDDDFRVTRLTEGP